MNRAVLASLPALLLLAACGSPKDANSSNFRRAIDKHLAQTCASISPGNRGYPASVEVVQPSPFRSQSITDDMNRRNNAPYAALVKAGLLSVTDGMVTPKPLVSFESSPDRKVPAKIYSLTSRGRAASTTKGYLIGSGFCVAHYKVDEILRFTQPGVTVLGTTTTNVLYTFSPADVSDWARLSEVAAAYPRLAALLANHQQAEITLLLTNKGWIEESDSGFGLAL